METQTPTFKLLKITNHDGTVNHVPLNRTNLNFYTEKKNSISHQKREKYLIEEVNLSLDEAVKLGVSEAVQTKFPPKQRKDPNADLIAALTQQNQLLMQMLADKQETPKKK